MHISPDVVNTSNQLVRKDTIEEILYRIYAIVLKDVDRSWVGLLATGIISFILTLFFFSLTGGIINEDPANFDWGYISDKYKSLLLSLNKEN